MLLKPEAEGMLAVAKGFVAITCTSELHTMRSGLLLCISTLGPKLMTGHWFLAGSGGLWQLQRIMHVVP